MTHLPPSGNLNKKNTASNLLVRETKAAEIMEVSVRTLQAWRQSGDGPRYVKLSPRAIRYRPSDIELWIEKRLRSSTSEA